MTTTIAPTAVRTASPRLLLSSQLIFNIGFYSVIPFLAVSLREDFAMGATAVGIVLGARTFAQQGMFLAGGAIADLWGPRYAMITGCLVRVTGYLLLAAAADFPLFLLAAIVTGIGGALFSPALESLMGSAEGRRKPAAANRPTLFALLVIFGEIGAVVGPLVGVLLLGIGLDAALYLGAGIFTVMALVFWRQVPATRPVTARPGAAGQESRPSPATAGRPQLWDCLKDKRFIGFAAFYSVNLLAHNQLYFGLPVELERSGLGSAPLGLLFAYASVLTVCLQWPVAKLTRRLSPRTALTTGFAVQSAGFAAVAALAMYPQAGELKVLPAVVLVTALCVGNMFVAPIAMGLVLEFAGGRRTGAFYGLLASGGGVMVLIGNIALGPLYEGAVQPSTAAAAPWLLTALLAAASAAGIRRFLPARPTADAAARA
ncbi:MFS transporter [Arthrobacter sp. ISL-69]|uniref:MFS transporter n=1 Tax=Arthrobacter sp. ISL-69 TaxID=2819113 RepID=UPI001BE7A9C4|nr:MFS transporter [Arthrobacter sp. ISL-69]MBT2534568.1 MFS transporter [Arthrobacter sp. ISL-69]